MIAKQYLDADITLQPQEIVDLLLANLILKKSTPTLICWHGDYEIRNGNMSGSGRVSLSLNPT